MTNEDKEAVLRLAGYVFVKCERPDGMPSWDWNWFDAENDWKETSEIYHQMKREAVEDAWLTMAERLDIPKELII